MRKAIAAVAIFAGGVFAQAQTDPVIEVARKAAAVYAKSLPDYVVRRVTVRYRKAVAGPTVYNSRPSALQPAAGSRLPGWQLIDAITADMTVQRGHEVYTSIQVNGSPARNLPPDGPWSEGEFSGETPMIFSPQSAASFTHPRAEKLRNHATVRYDFSVIQAHSTWSMASADTGSANLSYSPAYGGRVWIDKETGEAMRVEMEAHQLPRDFPVSSVQSQTDYDFIKIGDQEYLWPVHSETISCQPGGEVCFRNETEFKDFKKFESNSNITFDEPK